MSTSLSKPLWLQLLDFGVLGTKQIPQAPLIYSIVLSASKLAVGCFFPEGFVLLFYCLYVVVRLIKTMLIVHHPGICEGEGQPENILNE